MSSEQYYYIADIQRLYGIVHGSVAYWIKKGLIPTPELIKKDHSRLRRWPKAVIDAHLKAQQEEQA